MTDVFISYAKEDRKRIQKIARALIGEGFEVYVDPKAKSDGEWSAATRRELVNAAVILACWSEEGVQSTWVQAEASHAQDRQALISVSLEKCRVPTQFNRTEISDLSAWRGKADEPEFETVVHRVRLLLNVQRGLAEQPVLAPSVQLLTPPRPVQQQTAQVVAPSAFFSNTLGSRPAPGLPEDQQVGRHQPPRVARAPAPEPTTLRPPQPEARPRIEPIPDPEPPRRIEPVPERRPELRPEPRPEPRPAPRSEPRPEPRTPAPRPRVAAEAPPETPRFLRRDDRMEPVVVDAEPAEAPRRSGGAVAISLGLVAAVAVLGGGFFLMNQRSNGALGTSLASRLSAPKPEPIPEMAPLTPVETVASDPETEPAEATDLRPRLDQQQPEPTPPAPETRLAAATPAPAAPPPQVRVTPAPPAAAPQARPSTPNPAVPGVLPATVRAPAGRTPPAATPRAAKLVIPPAGAADAPAGATAAAAPGGDVVPRMERCLAQLVAYCPRGYGGRGAFAEDGTISAAERRFMSQRALFGWSEVSEANVENCQRHVQAASRATDSQPYQPLVTACATLPVAGPDR